MFCIKCGKNLKENDAFCGGCGDPQKNAANNNMGAGAAMGASVGNSFDRFEQENNTMAILGLVFAFVVNWLGLIFSIIGLQRAKEMNGKGRGMAMAGLIISIISIVLSIIWMILMFIYMREFMDWIQSIVEQSTRHH
ncbi:MAG: DUF4190 domain-containing protein [Firmicutes bacterium]|nr:DUF4190 domain-containing protein [Bacillota bacterium]